MSATSDEITALEAVELTTVLELAQRTADAPRVVATVRVTAPRLAAQLVVPHPGKTGRASATGL